MEFLAGDVVFLNVSPSKGFTRFGKSGNLAPRYIGPFKIMDRVGSFAYWVALPPTLSRVHNIFHVLLLRKYVHDPMLEYEPIEVREDLSYKERSMRMLDEKEILPWSRFCGRITQLRRLRGSTGNAFQNYKDVYNFFPNFFIFFWSYG